MVGILNWMSSERFRGENWSILLVLLVSFGFAVVGLHGLASLRVQAVAVGLVLAGACLLAGFLLGFLFGIPRSLQSQSGDAGVGEHESTDAANGSAKSSAGQSVQYRVNTNLEQISDWLTKILVGVGLTQLANVPPFLRKAGDYFGAGLAVGSVGPIFAITIILYFSMAGFLGGYLWTRIFLGRLFVGADLAALNETLQQVKKKQDEQPQIDAKVLTLVNRQLTGEGQVNIDELKEAIQKASAPVKALVFSQAREARKETRQKPIIERTIPIFESLAKSDTGKTDHKNYGQWGYALIGSPNPDYENAEKVFTTAIQIRGESGDRFRLYEFCRAISRIKQDRSYLEGKASSSEQQKLIRDDLKVAHAADPNLKDDEDIKKWQQLNPE
jgi:hypothetical protein